MTHHVTQPDPPASPPHRRCGGFTLIELLVTISIVAMLLSILLPALGSARKTSQAAVCLSNIRQLVMANTLYAEDARGYHVPAALDIYEQNLTRWHGQRQAVGTGDTPASTFDPKLGSLADYLGATGQVRYCPTFDGSIDHDSPRFEAGAGGYGYNSAYIGGRNDLFGTNANSARHTAHIDEIRQPTQTVMFTDAAFYKIVSGQNLLIDYSFAESPWVQQFPNTPPAIRHAPSTHFRHADRAHAGRADGHVTGEAMTFTRSEFESFYRDLGFGWFGPDSNDLFDLQ